MTYSVYGTLPTGHHGTGNELDNVIRGMFDADGVQRLDGLGGNDTIIGGTTPMRLTAVRATTQFMEVNTAAIGPTSTMTMTQFMVATEMTPSTATAPRMSRFPTLTERAKTPMCSMATPATTRSLASSATT